MGNLKEIIKPLRSEKLAEFLGVFLGDGSIASEYQVYISYNAKNEKAYAYYLTRLIFSLFGLETKSRVRKEASGDLVINSRGLVDFLCLEGMYRGSKIRQGSSLPEWVFSDPAMIKGALRGLFDTDGCVYRHKYLINGVLYQYPKIAFTAYSSVIRNQFFSMLLKLGFQPRDYNKRVHLYSQDQTLRYFEEIGTENSWHQRRFEEFCADRQLEKLFIN